MLRFAMEVNVIPLANLSKSIDEGIIIARIVRSDGKHLCVKWISQRLYEFIGEAIISLLSRFLAHKLPSQMPLQGSHQSVDQ